MEIIGWLGTALVIVAYGPQIHHLWAERCAWGISLWMWAIWLVASVLLFLYAWQRNEDMFVIVQSLNILAIISTLVLARRSNQICPYHLNVTNKKRRTK